MKTDYSTNKMYVDKLYVDYSGGSFGRWYQDSRYKRSTINEIISFAKKNGMKIVFTKEAQNRFLSGYYSE